MFEHVCKRCGGTWESPVAKPRVCGAGCRSRLWDKERERAVGGGRRAQDGTVEPDSGEKPRSEEVRGDARKREEPPWPGTTPERTVQRLKEQFQVKSLAEVAGPDEGNPFDWAEAIVEAPEGFIMVDAVAGTTAKKVIASAKKERKASGLVAVGESWAVRREWVEAHRETEE